MKDALGHGSDSRGLASGNITPQAAASAMHSDHVVGGTHDSTYPITKLSDSEFKQYAAKANSDFRQKMIASGHEYFPSLDRWFPAGTKISGHKPE